MTKVISMEKVRKCSILTENEVFEHLLMLLILNIGKT
jgi:hypothetical protein